MEIGWVGQESKQQAYVIKEANPGGNGGLILLGRFGSLYGLNTSESPWPRCSRKDYVPYYFPLLVGWKK